jgi:beta-lactamase class A
MIRNLIALLVLAAFASAQTSAPQGGEKQQLMWQKVEQAAHDAEHDLDGVLAVAVTDLKTGQKFGLHENELMPTASTIKIAVLAELYHQTQVAQQAGSGPHAATLTTPYVFDPRDLVPDSFIMGGLTPNVTRLTLRDVATMMIAVSDNSATNVLIDRVGLDNVNRYMESLGYPHILLRRKMMDLAAAKAGRENAAAPAELNALLEQIYNGKVFNKELTDDFLKMLSTGKDSAFHRALPDGVRMADKPGELEGVRNDCGIIWASRPFILCAMTTYDRRERDAERVIGRLADRVYGIFDRLGRASDLGRTISPGNSTPNP